MSDVASPPEDLINEALTLPGYTALVGLHTWRTCGVAHAIQGYFEFKVTLLSSQCADVRFDIRRKAASVRTFDLTSAEKQSVCEH